MLRQALEWLDVPHDDGVCVSGKLLEVLVLKILCKANAVSVCARSVTDGGGTGLPDSNAERFEV